MTGAWEGAYSAAQLIHLFKITSGYLCVNCDESPNFIHKIIFGGNNQNIDYWKLHVFYIYYILRVE